MRFHQKGPSQGVDGTLAPQLGASIRRRTFSLEAILRGGRPSAACTRNRIRYAPEPSPSVLVSMASL
jgi:hypothetical protein